jgi:hypothetical protein
MPTVVVLHGTHGRLGNRLMLQAHLMAFCLEHPGWRLVNFNFVPYAHLFEESRHHPWMIFPPAGTRRGGLLRAATAAGIVAAGAHTHLPPRWASRVSRHGTRLTHRLFGRRAELLEWGDGRRRDLGAPEFGDWAGRYDWVVLGGFLFRGWRALEAHQQVVRHFLRPAREYLDPAEALMSTLRARYRTVVGVLVRRTDYAHWLGGRFYFEPAQYRDWLLQLTRLFGPDAGLLLASDDPGTAALLEGLPAHLTTGAAGRAGHYMESLAALSMCDVVSSPPSTFGAMAAFLGDVPIMPLHTVGQGLRVQDLMRRHLFDAVEHPEFGRAVS